MSDTSPTTATGHGVASTKDNQLHGPWLVLARATYILIALTVVALNLVALPDIAASQLTPDVLRELRRQGFSPALYAAIGVAEGVVGFVVYLALSLLVFWRRLEERIAWFCAVMLVTFGGVAASPLDDITGSSPMPEPMASIAILRALVHLLAVVGQVSFVVFFYLFPSGRFVPRWTRWVALLALVYWLAEVFIFPTLSSGPLGSGILVFWLVAIVAQVYRYLSVSTPVEREQTKWIVFGLAAACVIVAIPSLLQVVLPAFATSVYSGSIIGGLIISNFWVVAILIIPIVIVVAILRAHLGDIDILINRALVYGSLSAILAAVYFGSVIAMQQVVRAIAGSQAEQNPLVIVLSTLLTVVLFTPLRRRLQRTIDRRFYRTKYNAAKTLEAFAASLRSEVELGALSAHLVAVVDETMRPAHISLWLRTTASAPRVPTVDGLPSAQARKGGQV